MHLKGRNEEGAGSGKQSKCMRYIHGSLKDIRKWKAENYYWPEQGGWDSFLYILRNLLCQKIKRFRGRLSPVIRGKEALKKSSSNPKKGAGKGISEMEIDQEGAIKNFKPSLERHLLLRDRGAHCPFYSLY